MIVEWFGLPDVHTIHLFTASNLEVQQAWCDTFLETTQEQSIS